MKPQLMALVFLVTCIVTTHSFFLRPHGKRDSTLQKKSSLRWNSVQKARNLQGEYYFISPKLINWVCDNAFIKRREALTTGRIRFDNSKFINSCLCCDFLTPQFGSMFIFRHCTHFNSVWRETFQIRPKKIPY